MTNRGGEEASDGGDGATARRTKTNFPRKRARKWRVPGHMRGQRQIKSHPNGGPMQHREEIHRDAQERQNPERTSHHLQRLHGDRYAGRAGNQRS